MDSSFWPDKCEIRQFRLPISIARHFSINTSKLPVFKRLLALLASIPPGEMNVNTLARNLEIDNKTVSSYLNMLQDTALIHSLKLDKGGKAGLRAPEKALLENANLYFAIAKETGFEPHLGALREAFFVNALRGAGIQVHFDKAGGYSAKGKVFEIGGEGKTNRRIRGVKNGILVKDGPMTGGRGEIPLYMFGFLW
jgi:predicted AAA+ superfamily ATPase